MPANLHSTKGWKSQALRLVLPHPNTLQFHKGHMIRVAGVTRADEVVAQSYDHDRQRRGWSSISNFPWSSLTLVCKKRGSKIQHQGSELAYSVTLPSSSLLLHVSSAFSFKSTSFSALEEIFSSPPLMVSNKTATRLVDFQEVESASAQTISDAASDLKRREHPAGPRSGVQVLRQKGPAEIKT
ncbi:uncharacterized protein FOMMEDRAFT_27032 [Fomitiporia mediterranea MF3/22]|uniref:uncharacterized protein n=1 Tax=Fomitiporia mediterranea (strain MF3/22) TaxID=694068 RepID=UPI00044083E9|nr:uncharacterized protein FOMMEDRAFT_27032 [Fomitiporia mediterranea MF3/22]EJD04689.1 hypothetical protein FOMMEDRAFT_27032 [Fomitiporia mediterranea MF3/22]